MENKSGFILALASSALHVTAQLFYEPSGSGAPNGWFIPVWLGSVLLFLACSTLRGVHTGKLQRFGKWTSDVVRKPQVWAPACSIFLAISIPVTLHAHRQHKPRAEAAQEWLDALENKLTDSFIADLKREHSSAAHHSRLQISSAARELLTGPQITAGNDLRLFIPLNETDYLFLWGNNRFEYCDIRTLHMAGVPNR